MTLTRDSYPGDVNLEYMGNGVKIPNCSLHVLRFCIGKSRVLAGEKHAVSEAARNALTAAEDGAKALELIPAPWKERLSPLILEPGLQVNCQNHVLCNPKDKKKGHQLDYVTKSNANMCSTQCKIGHLTIRRQCRRQCAIFCEDRVDSCHALKVLDGRHQEGSAEWSVEVPKLQVESLVMCQQFDAARAVLAALPHLKADDEMLLRYARYASAEEESLLAASPMIQHGYRGAIYTLVCRVDIHHTSKCHTVSIGRPKTWQAAQGYQGNKVGMGGFGRFGRGNRGLGCIANPQFLAHCASRDREPNGQSCPWQGLSVMLC